jgi:hypothetical protein
MIILPVHASLGLPSSTWTFLMTFVMLQIPQMLADAAAAAEHEEASASGASTDSLTFNDLLQVRAMLWR